MLDTPSVPGLPALLMQFQSGPGAWLIRAAMAGVFLYSAQDKLRHLQVARTEVAAGNLPFPGLVVSGTVIVQAFGGLALLSTWPAAIAIGAMTLAGFTLAATLLFHRFWLTRGEVREHQFTAFLEHLLMVGGLLSLAAQQGRVV